MPATTPAGLASVVGHLIEGRSFALASFVFVLYDYLITLDSEVRPVKSFFYSLRSRCLVRYGMCGLDHGLSLGRSSSVSVPQRSDAECDPDMYTTEPLLPSCHPVVRFQPLGAVSIYPSISLTGFAS